MRSILPKIVAGAALVLALVTGFLLRARPTLGEDVEEWWQRNGHHASHERNSSTSLKTILSAQMDFASNDRDRNGRKDYWRRDIAGLYTITPDAGEAIRLIELSVASADARPVTNLVKFAVSSAKAGYWFRALLHEGETAAAHDRFAACAFPDSPAAGTWTFIIDESGIIYRKKLRRLRGAPFFPLDPLKAGWQKLD